MNRNQGFTLLEILAALTITVVGITAVVKAAGSAVDVVQTSEDRILGSWIASNRLTELRLGRTWPGASTRDLSEKFGGKDWYYKETISTTSDPDLIRIDILVYKDKEHLDFSAKLFGYLSKYSPPSEVPLAWAGELSGQGQEGGSNENGDQVETNEQTGQGGVNENGQQNQQDRND